MTVAARSLAPPPVVVHDGPHPGCERYVATHPRASAYHAPEWLGVISRSFGHRTAYLVAETGGAISGVLPIVFFSSALFGRFTVSVPFVNYGGVLADDSGSARALLARAVEMTRDARGTHLELRHCGEQVFPELPAKRHKVAMEVPLEGDSDHVWSALDRKVRNQIRKAEKSGITVEEGHLELLPAFYQVFSHNMRDLGTPVYDINFFREVLFAFPDCTRVFCARHGGRPVAASVVLWNGGRIEVPWASALREVNPLCANVLLYWKMVQFAAERQFTVFDFGRSTPGEGTFHFKKQWGALARPLVWEYWTADGATVPDLNPGNPKFRLAIRAWQRLPVSVATTLGPHIVRNIP